MSEIHLQIKRNKTVYHEKEECAGKSAVEVDDRSEKPEHWEPCGVCSE